MRDNGKTMREAFLEERYKELGISRADVEEVINKDTMHEGLEGFKLDEKLAKVGKALKDKDAESLVNELGGNNNATRTKTWQKSFNVGAFSDLIGSASKNRLLGRNNERVGHLGHDDASYRDGEANTEVFAKITALKATNEPFWDKVF